jgi:Transposase DDE domain
MDAITGDSRMEISKMLSRFVSKAPLSVTVRMVLENQFGSARINGIFEEVAQQQYTKGLMFSTCVDLLVEVTLFGCSSVNAAFLRNRDAIPVSVVSVYEKLQGVEPKVCEALVGRTSQSAAELIDALTAKRPEPIRGYRLRIADGNTLRRTDRRLKVLRGTNVAALPGRTVSIFDHDTQLISQVVICENAHTSEKKIMLELLPKIHKNDLFMADCGFATMEFLQGLRDREAAFLVRHHSSMKLTPLTKRRPAGTCRTGKISEQEMASSDGQKFRVIIIERNEPLRNGKKEVILLTNLPKSKAKAKKLAMLYLKRWTIEEAFRQLTQYLSCEVNTLGYPKAALFAFSLAVVGYNCLACVKAVLASRYGWDKVDKDLSSFYAAQEIKRTYEGMCIAVPENEWLLYEAMSPKQLAAALRQIVKNFNWPRYQKSPRGPKRSVKNKRKKHLHVATAELLEKAKTKKAKERAKKP